MLEFIIMMLIITVLSKIPVGTVEVNERPRTEYTHKDNPAYDFKSLDDAMEYRELRATGWKGNAIDYYRWKEEE